jgi:Reverse transcriptase (RNA-dependent DNA polymerase)
MKAPSLELSDAFLRMQKDQQGRTFYKHPSDLLILTANHRECLAALQESLDEGKYTARPAPSVHIPKPNWHVRPAAILTLEDQVVYHYLALLAKPVVAPQLEWSEGKVRYSNFLAKEGASWFRRTFLGWKNFDRTSIRKLQDSPKYVLLTDIAGYYENIDIGRLVQDLRASGVDGTITQTLSMSLNKWAGPRGRGIPQGYSPSDLMGEFYLNSIDRALATEGFDHVRYLDDFRVFAGTRTDSVRALHRLSDLPRERGLNLQTAKSEILESDKALERIAAVARALADVSERIGSQLEDLGNPYITPAALRKYIQSDPDDPAPAVVEAAWFSFEAGEFGGFNKSVFHYLLARLSDLESGAAVPFAVRQLSERPEETAHCLAYLGQLPNVENAVYDAVASVLSREETVFGYQKYQIVRWFWELQISNDTVRMFCRQQLAGGGDSFLVQPYAAVYLGDFADGLHDYEKLESAFYRDTNELTRGAYLYALRLAPSDVKGRVYGRARGESPYLDWAIKIARDQR